MNTIRELFDAAVSGYNITENVAVKSSTGTIYKKTGELHFKNYDMSLGAPCLIKKAVFTSSDIPVGTSIVSFGFYCNASGKMYEECTVFGGGRVTDDKPLEIFSEVCIAVEPNGIIIEKQDTRFFRWFFEGEKYNKIHAEVYTENGVKNATGKIYSTQNAIGFSFDISPICTYTHFNVYMDGEYCFCSRVTAVNTLAITIPAGTANYEVETEYSAFSGVEYTPLNLMPMHLYDHTSYSKELIPIDNHARVKDLFSCEKIFSYRDVIYALRGGELITYRFFETNLNRVSHGEIAQKDIVSCHLSKYSEVFVMTKSGGVNVYRNYVQKGLMPMKQVNTEIFEGATSIHLSSGLYPLMVLYQERDKCIAKEFSYTLSNSTQILTYEQVNTRVFKRPAVYTVADSDYKLIVDKEMGKVSLITGIGVGLKVNESIQNKILKAKNFSFYDRTLFLQNPKLEIYDIVTGEKFEDDNTANGKDYYTMKCGDSRYYARVYYDNTFTIHTFCPMDKRYVKASEKLSLESKPIKFVAVGRYVYVLLENGKHKTFMFNKQYFKINFKQPHTANLRLLLCKINVRTISAIVRFYSV